MVDNDSGPEPDPQTGHRLSPFGKHAEQERAREDSQEDAERKDHEASFEERDRGGVDEDCRRRPEREPPSREHREEEQKRERDEQPQRSGRGVVVVAPERKLERAFERGQQHEDVEAVPPDQRPGPAREVRDPHRHVSKVVHRSQSVVVREDDFKIIRSDE